jgi:DNA-binding protein HU-beta
MRAPDHYTAFHSRTGRGYTVNKADLVAKLAAKAGFSKKNASKAIDAMVDLISGALAANENVTLTGFGKFEVRARKASTRVNPQTRKKISVPAKVVPAFKAGKNLKELVAKKARR